MINFLKYKKLYFFISAIVILSGLFSIVRWGYIYSIDFVGGTNLEYKISRPTDSQTIKKIAQSLQISVETISVNNNSIFMRTKAIDDKKENIFKTNLSKRAGSITVLRSETVGPTLGRETIIKTITASVLAVIGILIYMSFAFKGFNFAVAAVLAMLHDLIVVVGCYSLLSHFFGAQLDTLFVTAILTTMSFSVHDTIIVFDKIREYRREEGVTNIEHSANKAFTETMVRSLNNSMTIIFMLLALVLLGGITIKFFAATLLIGTITGTYSSPFVATPLLVWLEKRKSK